ncbi:hypothetical protein P5E67_00725 [Vibrio parahaemolyticus]|nr:hypothetical protein [Vibrio parahaemolyticus]
MITLQLNEHKVFVQVGSKNELFWREKGYQTEAELAAKPIKKPRVKKAVKEDVVDE